MNADQIIAAALRLEPSEQRRVWRALRPESLDAGPAARRRDARWRIVHQIITGGNLPTRGRAAWVNILRLLWDAAPEEVLTRPLRPGETLESMAPVKRLRLTIKHSSLKRGYRRWLNRRETTKSCPDTAA